MKPIVWICLTVWAIATECLVVDLIKYNARVELLEQAARSLGRANSPSAPQTLDHL
jgi:hypothetical protein